ncbi:MAG: metal ABC transporter ATP-binding protein [Methylocystaceae bacterium]
MDHNGSPCGLCCTTIENFGVKRGKEIILENINLHIHCGELTAVIGPNGAGKTTLLKAILGEIPHSGSLRYLNAHGERSNRPVVGYVPQRLDFDRSSPVSVLDLFAASLSSVPVWLRVGNKLRQRAITSLKRVHAAHLVHRRLGNLSGGELQRVLLALALEPIPDLLLLDEPGAGMDETGLHMFYRLVSGLREQYDLSIILVSHDLDLVSRYANRIVYLNRTVIKTGSPAEVLMTTEVETDLNSPRLAINTYCSAEER